jgi:hypothetical protein
VGWDKGENNRQRSHICIVGHSEKDAQNISWMQGKRDACAYYKFTTQSSTHTGVKSQSLVDVLVVAGGIPSWTTFLREEEDSKKSKEDHRIIEEHPGKE